MPEVRAEVFTPARRFLFLVNERAVRGPALRQFGDLFRGLPLGDQAAATATFVDDEGLRRGLERLEDDTVPVAVGGDGTVISVVRGLRAAGRDDRPLGILPLGTGNGVAHSLGIRSQGQATRALCQGQPLALDLMRTTHPQASVCLLNLSVGLESLVMADVAARRSRSAVLAGLLAAGRRLPGRMRGVRVVADGQGLLEPSEPFYNVGLYNLPCYGFGVQPRPAADPADGAADLRLHRGRLGYWTGMGAAALRVSSLVPPQRRWPRVHRATITAPIPVQADGETLEPATFQVEVLPGALQVLAPPQGP